MGEQGSTWGAIHQILSGGDVLGDGPTLYGAGENTWLAFEIEEQFRISTEGKQTCETKTKAVFSLSILGRETQRPRPTSCLSNQKFFSLIFLKIR